MCLEQKYQEKGENAYLTVKSSTASPRPPAYRVMYLQTKPDELKPLIFSDKENRNCIC